MGLDSVELVIDVEKRFGINIPDKEAEKIFTVEDFHNVVWNHLEGQHHNRCISQSLFYTLRTALHKWSGIPISQIKMDTAPEKLLPQKNRRRIYASLAAELCLDLPQMILTPFFSTLLNAFAILTVFGSLLISLVLIIFYDLSKWTLLLPIAGAYLTDGFSILLEPKRVIIPHPTMRAFTSNVLASNYTTLTHKGYNRQDVEIVINYIIADKCGVELTEVSPEKSITKDLGID